jgi:hypothetical protein
MSHIHTYIIKKKANILQPGDQGTKKVTKKIISVILKLLTMRTYVVSSALLLYG